MGQVHPLYLVPLKGPTLGWSQSFSVLPYGAGALCSAPHGCSKQPDVPKVEPTELGAGQGLDADPTPGPLQAYAFHLGFFVPRRQLASSHFKRLVPDVVQTWAESGPTSRPCFCRAPTGPRQHSLPSRSTSDSLNHILNFLMTSGWGKPSLGFLWLGFRAGGGRAAFYCS